MAMVSFERPFWRLGWIVPAILLACNSDPISERASRTDPRPEIDKESANPSSLVSNSNMQTGFARGTIRAARSVGGFRIGTHPVTWEAFGACVSAGSCAEATTSECSPSAYSPYETQQLPDYAARTPQAPAVCVGKEQAEAYCKWSGGRLPTLDEWLLAARGNAPRRFAWGEQKSSCNQHPLSHEPVARKPSRGVANEADLTKSIVPRFRAAPDEDPAEPLLRSCAKPGFDGSELLVGRHKQGASPFGVEDVLLAPGELLKSDALAPFNACGEPSSHCVVFGLEPAAIDSVEPFVQVPSEEPGGVRDTIGHAYSFRCVSPVSAGG